jgi:hypothetical protein
VRGRNPFFDRTKTRRLDREDRTILSRIAAGEKLMILRTDAYDESGKSLGILNYFGWGDLKNNDPSDFVVWMLLRRGLIRPTGCAGGAEWFVIDEEAGE